MAWIGAEPLPSVVVAPSLGLGDLEGQNLMQAIAGRVAKAPQGRFWSLREPNRPRSQSHAELWNRSSRMAAGMVLRGLPHGSPVVIALEDGIDFIPAFWACLRAGYVAVPLSGTALEPRFGDRTRVFAEALATLAPRLAILERGLHDEVLRRAPSCVCVSPGEIEAREPLAENASPADLAYVLATSGSTGAVKLVAVGSRTLMYHAFKAPDAAMVDAGARINTSPVYSTTGLSCVLLAQREFVHLPMATLARSPTSLFDAVETFRASSFSITDTMASRLVEVAGGARRWDLSSLRQVGFGAETVLSATVRRFNEVLSRFGAPSGIIRAGYGMTETGTLVTGADPLASDLVGGLGVPLGTPVPNVALRIVDGAGEVVSEGTVGEVEVHAPLKMFSFYWGDPEATARGFTVDGWWRTGDMGLLWRGQLALRGRSKEVFISNGRKHALGAIDEAMREGLAPGEAAYACTVPSRSGGAEGLGVALLASAERRVVAEAAIRQAVGRAFGLPVAMVRTVPATALPLTPTGKVKRLELAALLSGQESALDDAPAVSAQTETAPPKGEAADQIWEAVLGPGSARKPDADFFSLGGDSLRAAVLLSRVQREIGIAIEPRLFFADPTLATLQNLAQITPSPAAGDEPTSPNAWPLSPDQYRKQLAFVEQWAGVRPTADRLVVGYNTEGSKLPIFLVGQEEQEARNLALNLGLEQPVYGFRSGFLIMGQNDDEMQAFALRYVADIETLHPAGPVLLAGVCHGSMLALAMAQHLMRRRRYVPLLALLEWQGELRSYPGRILYLYADESTTSHPYRKFREPEHGWRRYHAAVEVVAVPGDHWHYLKPENMPRTAAILTESFGRALRLPALQLAAEHCRAAIGLGPVPSRIVAGQTFAIEVSVTNTSGTPWADTATSGLMLGYRWVDGAGQTIMSCQGRAALPAIAPSAPHRVSLIVTAPASASRANLVVDIVEEGNAWFGSRHPEGPARAIVDVL